ncbi:adhesion G-protein coupled receptor G7-like [Drosophila novamexicana]|uniref:adhesion G-protein coupled receptor G7-like n=1 Tax=Drosophila novamexicana TaxID=47314 RepID=UPI0011E5FB35|nr:adhesion G-protein coupled receptor G7-like [Drosophila novamexicana]
MNFLLAATLLAFAISAGRAYESAESDDNDDAPDNCPKEQQLCRLEWRNSTVERCVEKLFRADITGLAYCNALHCEPEVFLHDYITRNHDQSPHNNTWKKARIGEAATLHDICLLRNGLPVTRKCQVKGMRAQWEPIDKWAPVVCMRRFRERSITVELNSLHDDLLEGRRRTNNAQERRHTTALMRDMFRQEDRTLLPADVHVAGQVFVELMEQEKDAALSGDLISICREIMSSDANVLQLSAQLNATNSLLNSFEDYMDALPQQLVPRESCGKVVVHAASEASDSAANGVEVLSKANIGVHALMSSNLSVLYVNPSCDNITGVAIYSSAAPNRHSSGCGFWYRFLYANENLEQLRRETNLETATYVPEQLWRQLSQRGASYLILKVYAHDGLFVEDTQKRSRRPRSKVLSISIPGFEGKALPQSLPFLLHNENHRQPDALAVTTGSGCGYWNYRTWLSDGITTISGTDMLREPVIVCQTRHLTQFSYLLGGSYRSNDLGAEVLVTPINERVLDIISIVGCCLSLFGVLGIFLTAALFKSWRSQASTKVLLHLCMAMMLQMVLFVFINTDDISEQLVVQGDNTRCVLLGATLQYSILALFCWMLIIAFLQFQRYVTVIGIERPRHYILKAALVAWSLPLLPTLLVACIDPGSYLPTAEQLAMDTGICYPSGYGLIFGVVLPVTLITVANLVIFVYVFYSISHSLSQSIQRAERKLVSKQIRLSVLLFFLLGLSWIFGIFAFLQAGVAFSYLFCLTATLQGFVLFVYFVLLDEVNRRAWIGLLWPTKMKMDVQKRTTELQSMTTSSTNYSARSEH